MSFATQFREDVAALVTRAVGAIWVDSVREWAEASTAHGTFPTRAERLTAVDAQSQLIDLIEAGDEVKIADVMTTHFNPNSLLGGGVDRNKLVGPLAARDRR